MSDTPLNPPDSPPTPPVIPEGLATKLGKFGALILLGLTALSEATDVQIDGTSTKTFWASIGLLAVTMLGRYFQAAMLYRDAPSPNQIDDFSGDLDYLTPGDAGGEDGGQDSPTVPPGVR